jgi:hypothetical protein
LVVTQVAVLAAWRNAVQQEFDIRMRPELEELSQLESMVLTSPSMDAKRKNRIAELRSVLEKSR